jgi:hypothetical protein
MRCAAVLVACCYHCAFAAVTDVQPLPAGAGSRPARPVHPSWGSEVRSRPGNANFDISQLGVGLPDQSGKAVSDHGRGAEDGSDALSSLKPASNLQLATRALFLAFAFFLPVLLSGLALLSSWFRDKVWYGLLVRSIARSGAAFIKVSTHVLQCVQSCLEEGAHTKPQGFAARAVMCNSSTCSHCMLYALHCATCSGGSGALPGLTCSLRSCAVRCHSCTATLLHISLRTLGS